jgi:3-oxoacyl-[acyl-carrier-protein] synthase II
MASAGLTPDDIAYVNAHGTATRFNDLAEASALRLALGDHRADVAVSSTKSLTGHALGAAGAIEAVACVQAIDSGVLPPTANLDRVDPDIDLDVIGTEPRRNRPAAVLSDSFAFGGHNVVLAFSAVR